MKSKFLTIQIRYLFPQWCKSCQQMQEKQSSNFEIWGMGFYFMSYMKYFLNDDFFLNLTCVRISAKSSQCIQLTFTDGSRCNQLIFTAGGGDGNSEVKNVETNVHVTCNMPGSLACSVTVGVSVGFTGSWLLAFSWRIKNSRNKYHSLIFLAF